MTGWNRNSLFSETGLPWVLPSPNMPTLQTATVYSGTVLIEALNISEGRGTTTPFELLGAPFIDAAKLKRNLDDRHISGCKFRVHYYIPTFHKFCGETCNGIQIHVTEPEKYRPVEVALDVFDAIMETSPGGLSFNPPPYEYEEKLMPFDILSGDSVMRESLLERRAVNIVKERWREEIEEFKNVFNDYSAYKE
jgi:uncharacterized protein YbbC (DUF1343 family)